MLPSTNFSEIVELTAVQLAKVNELKELGWEQVTPAEGTFNGALIMESPDGNNYFVKPDGTINLNCT